ncbi:hypothetical protein [Sphingosinicella sp.]|uniref:hypothetical protein n=1 Tax=Sphingosinicella sp. TaxID=1917971 RepID=UPI00403780B1
MLALSASVLVAGCSVQVTPMNNIVIGGNQTNAAVPAPAPQNSADAAPVEGGAPVDRAFIVGRWGMDGDCANALDFREDGTVQPNNGRWTLEGSQLTVVNQNAPTEVSTVTRSGDDRMTVAAGGNAMNFSRCQ